MISRLLSFRPTVYALTVAAGLAVAAPRMRSRSRAST